MSVWPIGQRVRLVQPYDDQDYGKEGVIELYRKDNEIMFECDEECCDCAVVWDEPLAGNDKVRIYTHHTSQLEPITSH